MSCFGRPRRLAISLLLLPLCLETACSRPAVGSADSTPPADQHQVPFRDADGSAQGNPGVPQTAQNKGAKAETDLPFRDLQSLPAGTLLIVRLKNSISADNSGSSGAFEALVDEPVSIDGNTLVPRGALVAGRVESARSSGVKRSGYVRLALDSIDIGGKALPLQTSSLLARGNTHASDASLALITLEKGRRLTFQLAEPVYVALQQSSPAH
jgi:hypothetical protein